MLLPSAVLDTRPQSRVRQSPLHFTSTSRRQEEKRVRLHSSHSPKTPPRRLLPLPHRRARLAGFRPPTIAPLPAQVISTAHALVPIPYPCSISISPFLVFWLRLILVDGWRFGCPLGSPLLPHGHSRLARRRGWILDVSAAAAMPRDCRTVVARNRKCGTKLCTEVVGSGLARCEWEQILLPPPFLALGFVI